MQYTSNYNLNLPEGTDVVNLLTQMNPNTSAIDAAMFANKQAVIGTATELTAGTVHAITRANTDSDSFKFTATSNWSAGDTMTLDGNSVNVYLSDGTTPVTGAYVINSEVLAIVSGSRVTLIVSGSDQATLSNKANKTELSNITESGVSASQNIYEGQIFYLNGALVKAVIDIPTGSTFSLNTNYITLPDGGLNGVIPFETISVMGDGVKTFSQLFDALFTQIDHNKITKNSVLTIGSVVYRLNSFNKGISYTYERATAGGSRFSITNFTIRSNSSTYINWEGNTSGNSGNEHSSDIVTNGVVIKLYY